MVGSGRSEFLVEMISLNLAVCSHFGRLGRLKTGFVDIELRDLEITGKEVVDTFEGLFSPEASMDLTGLPFLGVRLFGLLNAL